VVATLEILTHPVPVTVDEGRKYFIEKMTVLVMHAFSAVNYRMQSFQPSVLPGFGLRLRQIRLALGQKQSALSDALDINQSTLSRWETGLQIPGRQMQQKVFELLAPRQIDDHALRRLVETSSSSIHLIEETTHRCLAFSKKRATDWGNGDHESLIGTSLWRFATTEIQSAEKSLSDLGWWSARLPNPESFQTSAKTHDEIVISFGQVIWERMYLSDGTPVRLCTSIAKTGA
jgi:hypothetical protein